MLEKEHFNNRTADYVYMLMIVCGLLTTVAAVMNLMLLGPALIMAVLYVWSRVITSVNVSIFFFPAIKVCL